MSILAGMDGCPGKWIAICVDLASKRVTSHLVDDLGEFLLSKHAPSLVGIDIPIGLSEDGYRTCDKEARKLIGARRSSVFTAPIRPAVHAESRLYADAISRQFSGKGVAAQAFGIYAKVKEVDELLQENPLLKEKLFEVHPELCFTVWNEGEPMARAKRTLEGFTQRLALVESHFGAGCFDEIRKEYRKGQVADDDILDAFAALWTAERMHLGQATQIPAVPETDSTGLPMAMWA